MASTEDSQASSTWQPVVRPTSLQILGMVEGPGGQAVNVQTAEELADAIGNLGGSTVLAAAGSDTMNGGAGNDIIFGDAPFTDDLATKAGRETTCRLGLGKYSKPWRGHRRVSAAARPGR